MKTNEVIINKKLIRDKTNKIGEILDGLSVSDVLAILGAVILELVMDLKLRGYNLDELIEVWLSRVIEGIKGLTVPCNDKALN